MRESVLLLPDLLNPPSWPAFAALRSSLKANYEVEEYVWPWITGGAKWSSFDDLLRELRGLADGRHVVSAANATAAVLVALDGVGSGGAMVCDGIFMPIATLRAAGRHSEAEAVRVYVSQPAPAERARLFNSTTDDAEVAALAREINERTDWQLLGQYIQPYVRLNLLEIKPDFRRPTLYIEPPLGFPYPGRADVADLFLQMVPHAEVVRSEMWPLCQNEHQPGIAFAARVNDFLARHPIGTA